MDRPSRSTRLSPDPSRRVPWVGFVFNSFANRIRARTVPARDYSIFHVHPFLFLADFLYHVLWPFTSRINLMSLDDTLPQVWFVSPVLFIPQHGVGPRVAW